MRVEPRQALFAHLRADPGVQAAVKNGQDSVYQRRVPVGARKPLIVIWPTISDVPMRDLNSVAYRRARIQVTAMADTQPEAEKAARAVIGSVEGFTGLMAASLTVIQAAVDSDRQVDQDGVDEIHHHVDVMIIYKEG